MVRRGVRVLVVAFVVVWCGVVCVSSAGAASQYPAVGQFEGLQEPSSGIAVAAASDGDVFVGDELDAALGSEQVVRVFGASGGAEAAWRGTATPSGSFGSEKKPLVAVDAATGRVYVADLTHHVIDVFSIASGVSEDFVCQITGVAVAGEVPSAPDECDPAASSVPLGAGVFSKEAITALAVDPASGGVFVGYGQAPAVVYRFSEAGAFEAELPGAPVAAPEDFREFGEVGSVAVDDVGLSRRLLVSGEATEANHDQPFLCVFEAQTNEFVECLSGSGAPGNAVGAGPVAVDEGTGEVFLSDGSEGVSVYGLDGHFIAQIPGIPGQPLLRESGRNLFGELGESQDVFGLAVNSSTHLLYAAVGYPAVVDVFGDQPVKVPTVVTAAAAPVHAYNATLDGMVNPEGEQVTSCRFEIVEEGQEWRDKAFGAAKTVPCAESTTEIGAGSVLVPVHAVVEGLNPQSKYHARLVAANENETANLVSYGSYGADVPFTTLPVPVIVSQSSEHITPSSADIAVSVNPEGAETSCVVEYGTSSGYGASVPCEPASLGAGSEPVGAMAHLAGLTGGVTYHWRVVVESTAARIAGADQTFVYLAGPEVSQECANEQLRSENRSLVLPDCRAYEQVTPVFKNGGVIERGLFIGPTEASAEGSRVIGISIQGFAGTQASNGNRRVEGDPYEFTRTGSGWVTTPMAPPATVIAANTNYIYNPDTGSALFSGPSAPAGQDDFYVRSEDGSLVSIGPSAPPAAGETGPVRSVGAASRDEESFTYSIAEPVQQWLFDPTHTKAPTLYEYSGAASEPMLVGVTGGAGSTSLLSVCGTTGGGEASMHLGSLSGDGRVAFFTALKCSKGSGENAGAEVAANELFARVGGDETVLLSQRASKGCENVCAVSVAGAAEFQGASEDGSVAYFTSTQQLTGNASEDEAATAEDNKCAEAAGVNGCNLYMYDFDLPVGERLVDVSAVSAGEAGRVPPGVQGVMAVSGDGSHVYFVARGVLAGNTNSEGDQAETGADNLYVYERDSEHPEGHLAFIAQLPNADAGEWREGTVVENVNSNVTPDGGFLVFESHGALTADDTRGLGPAQIYRYDAENEELTRVSVGEHGYNDDGNAGVAGARVVRPRDYRGDPSMSNNGEYVFFESPTGLTPAAANDVKTGVNGGTVDYEQNIYEWHAGQVYLISDGRDTSASGEGAAVSDVRLIGSDASGANVFFTTADQLVPADTDTQVDVYDARIDGGFPAPAETPVCVEGACRGPGSLAPSLGEPLSGAFEGTGNTPAAASKPAASKPKRCSKDRKLSHGRCVKSAAKPKKSGGPKKKKRGGAARRRGRVRSSARGDTRGLAGGGRGSSGSVRSGRGGLGR
jgi:hypothetical protein